MPTLEERVKDDIKLAMKAGRREDLDVLRMLMSDAKNTALQEDTELLADELMLKVLRKGVKTRNESIEQFRKGGREDLAARELAQIEVLKRYLPAEAGEAEITAAVDTALAGLATRDKSAMGQVIKEVMAKLGGRADGKAVSRVVASRLAGALLLLLLGCGTPRVSPESFHAHVAWLADDARGGRDTGTPELFASADYVAAEFEDAGLLPGGQDGGWLQRFTVQGARRLIEGNALTLAGAELSLHEDWIPFASSVAGAREAELVFAGYGIVDEERGFDDYAGLDVQDKIVVVLRKGPRVSAGGETPYREGEGQQHITFARKVNNAFRHGAAAILVVNDPLGYPPGSEKDALVPYGQAGMGGVGASLPAAHLTAEAGARALAAGGVDLAATQRAIDDAMKPQPVSLHVESAHLVVAAEQPTLETVNVVGWLPGHDPALDGECIVLGAHLDHVGTATRASSRGGPAATGQIHNGADDNASGIAGLIEGARLLASRDDLPRGVAFVAFSGEEWGLLGSRHFAEQPLPADKQVVAMVNMDMIGRSQAGYVSVEGIASSPGFQDLVERAEAEVTPELDLHVAPDPSGNSDQASFYEQGIPVLNLFTGLHEDYHMPSDDVEKINSVDGARIATLAAELTARLAALETRPPFVAPPEEDQLAQGERRGRRGRRAETTASASPHGDASGTAPVVVGYGVVLGTSPDMGYQGEDGVRIASVRSGTPAESAGLLPGDLIVALDGAPIRNLEDYSVLLFSHQPGDEVAITVRREGAELIVKAVLAARGGES